MGGSLPALGPRPIALARDRARKRSRPIRVTVVAASDVQKVRVTTRRARHRPCSNLNTIIGAVRADSFIRTVGD